MTEIARPQPFRSFTSTVPPAKVEPVADELGMEVPEMATPDWFVAETNWKLRVALSKGSKKFRFVVYLAGGSMCARFPTVEFDAAAMKVLRNQPQDAARFLRRIDDALEEI